MLAEHGRVQIPEFLPGEEAFSLYRCLAEQLHWQLTTGGDDRAWTSARDAYPDGAGYQKIALRAQAQAEHGYQYLHDCYSPQASTAPVEYGDPGQPIDAVPALFNSPRFLAQIRALSGDPKIARVTAQALRLRPGQFLLPQEPAAMDAGRRYFYALHLTPQWRAEWGGLLQSLDEHGGIHDSYLPSWNTLSLLRLPQRHQLTLVAPWAPRPQYAIVGGWWVE
ncbi:2-oxoglutarate-Fe(II)-dependent oxygenase superfamily protein [Luteimonas cucumeris]|uniref:2-oxoglutarate-Fe(II)-dependent oxygenase superfamily protein n=2 Tax=Luteimonas cucumeris TaxID=985012 RepID=A0A562KX34_9GAMM|nr:2-oxoglutarate-Fe(II)-dependent oxygenase superfamily protein [Luteimonas cucumeris]